MNKKEYISYWLKSADKDLEVLAYLTKGRKYVHALFFGHLYIEKICKALRVQNNTANYPPKTHNLLKLLDEARIDLVDEDRIFLLKLNTYQIEGRYPDDIQKLYRITNKALVTEYQKSIKRISKWLQKQMQ